jgi:lipopolysaccharide biosynthesis glycosyltransferase
MLAHKYLPKGAEWSLYIDADMVIKEPLTKLLNNLHEDTLFAACRHSYCGSVREEIEDLVAKGMVDTTQIDNQWLRYAEWGFKDNLGISENGLLIRRHNDAHVVQLMELWWEEYQNGCLRDQVSLMPCMYQTDIMPYFQFIEMDIRNNNFVDVMRHKVDK